MKKAKVIRFPYKPDIKKELLQIYGAIILAGFVFALVVGVTYVAVS